MRWLFSLFFMLLLLGPAFAQDQQTLNVQAEDEFARADKKLNEVYRQLVRKLSQAEKEKLIDAQLLWIKFRDASAEARAESNRGGSIYPMIYAGARRRATVARTQELQEWLDEYK